MNNIQQIFIISILFTVSSCGEKEIEFDKAKWNEQIDGFYEYRENMVNDLMKNHLRKGMTYDQLTNLIGSPGNYANLEENTDVYGIMEDYGWDIDPVETKTLKIELTKDSLIKNYSVEHWKK